MRKVTNKNSPNWFLIVVLSVFVVVIVLFGVKIGVSSSVMHLSEYEKSVCDQYMSSNLDFMERTDLCLSDVASYIDSNKVTLLVNDYERNSNTLVVHFLFGLDHVFEPSMFLLDSQVS